MSMSEEKEQGSEVYMCVCVCVSVSEGERKRTKFHLEIMTNMRKTTGVMILGIVLGVWGLIC